MPPRVALRPLGTLALVACCTLLAVSPPARADVVFNNLDQSDDFIFPADQLGAAVVTGSVPITVTSVVLLDSLFGIQQGETFGVYSRKADGTLGSKLFGNFSLSYDNLTGLKTATANSPFVLQANTGYWLVQDDTPGTIANWDATASTTYTSAFGLTLPVLKTSFGAFTGTYTYYDLADGPQLFQLNGTPFVSVPEPSPLALTSAAGFVGMIVVRFRRRRAA